MANLKEIRKRITSVKKTQKTTSAMKMVSAAKLRRAQDAYEKAAPYAEQLKKVVANLSAQLSGSEHPLFKESNGKRIAVIMITSDRGLCGSFNLNVHKIITREIEALGAQSVNYSIIGRKGRDLVRRTKHTISDVYADVTKSQQIPLTRTIAQKHVDMFLKGEVDQVYLAYAHFQSALTQVATIDKLLPVVPPTEGEEADAVEMIFEPSKGEILDSVLAKYLQNQIQISWFDSNTGEHAARMAAMDSATKNAGEMIEKLQLYYNRSRQAMITKELIEIISGAESV